ncbi:MAG: YibE/F family protein [Candidatus Paceibacterota bacterium]
MISIVPTKKHRISAVLFCMALFLFPGSIFAQELHRDTQGVLKARVVEISSAYEEVLPGTERVQTIQTIQAEILDGEKKGEVVEVINDYLVLKEGQVFYLNYLVPISGEEIYTVRDIDRLGGLLWVVIIFILAVLLLGKKQGVRSLLSLSLSLCAIVFLLLPLIRGGMSPVLASALVSACVLALALFFTHGVTMKSTLAFVSTVSAVIFTTFLASFAIYISHLSGFSSEEAVFLNFNTFGTLDFKGLLLGGIIIGILGVLDDIAITQVAVVYELARVAPNMSFRSLYMRALRVGREHVSALVNTLVLAYTGVSLPLLLLFSTSSASFVTIINQEVFATEIVRTLVGSVGLIATVPLSTFLACFWVTRYGVGERDELEDDISHGHIHSH